MVKSLNKFKIYWIGNDRFYTLWEGPIFKSFRTNKPEEVERLGIILIF